MIDKTLLPAKALLDTGVLIRFLGDRPEDSRSPVCKAFCDAMLDQGHELLISAPTLAEVMRYKGARIPRTHGMTPVPFDDKAAEILALSMPLAKIHETSDRLGISRTYLKYDAMIAACALRARADVIVTLDPRDHAVMAKELGIRIAQPDEFLAAQVELPLPPPVLPPSPEVAN